MSYSSTEGTRHRTETVGGMRRSAHAEPLLTLLSETVTQSWEQEAASRRPPNQTPSTSSNAEFATVWCPSVERDDKNSAHVCTWISPSDHLHIIEATSLTPCRLWGHITIKYTSKWLVVPQLKMRKCKTFTSWIIKAKRFNRKSCFQAKQLKTHLRLILLGRPTAGQNRFMV